jgi:hypothetical protein
MRNRGPEKKENVSIEAVEGLWLGRSVSTTSQ